jgi:hypothetical protein
MDLDVRFYAPGTGERVAFDKDVVTAATWEVTEAGGLGQASFTLARPLFDEEFDPDGFTIVKVWGVGETYPRYIGQVSQPEASLETKETRQLVAYGRMEDMNHCVLNKVLLFPGGEDLAVMAAEVLSDYEKRRSRTFERDIQTTGVTVERLDLAKATARDAMNKLMESAAGSVVWGWEVNPDTGNERFYLRPRTATVTNTYQVGSTDGVKLLHSPAEFQTLVNSVVLTGGKAKFPNLVHNPSFENPTNPSAESGDLLIDGGFELGTTWTYLNGGSRNQAPGSNVHSSAHTGQWVLELDNATEEAYQDVTVVAGHTYKCLCYAARESGTGAATGRLLLVDGSTTYTLPLAPPSTSWMGGQDSTILGGDGLSLTVTPTTTTVRVRLIADSGSTNAGLLIDDVIFAEVGAVGQDGWGTHVEVVGSSSNEFNSIDWACKDSPWDGYYCVRADVKAADQNHKTYIAPTPQDNAGVSGFHYQPQPQESLRVGFRVRMKPGSGAGEARVEYREWAGDGHETQHVYGTYTAIPDDSAWHLFYEDVSVHGDAATATHQIAFSAPGVYDVDGFFARDVASGEGTATDALGRTEFLRGDLYESYVKCTDVCTPGSEAYDSLTRYGVQESAVTLDAVIDNSAAAQAVLKAFFDRNAAPIRRPRLEIDDETALPAISPASGGQASVTGLAITFPDSYISRTEWRWGPSSKLACTVELTRERVTWAKLLNRAAASGGGAGFTGAFAAGIAGNSGVGGGTTGGSGTVLTPAPAGITVGDGVTEFYPVPELDFPLNTPLTYDTTTQIATVTPAITVGDGSTENYPVSTLDFPVGGTVAYDALTDTATFTPDGKVLVDGSDTTRGFLDDKIAVDYGLRKQILSPAGNEQEQIRPIATTTVADASTITIDAAAAKSFIVVLGGNHTFGPPSNPPSAEAISGDFQEGLRYLQIQEDGTGGWTPDFDTVSANGFSWGSGPSGLTQTAFNTAFVTDPDAINFVGISWSPTLSKWCIVSLLTGYS